MSFSTCRPHRVAAWTAASAVAALALASAAVAAPTAPTGVSVSPGGPTNAGSVTVNWTPPDSGDAVSYVGGFVQDPASDPAGSNLTPGTISAPSADGVWYFKVAGVGPGGPGDIGPYGTSGGTVTIDRTPPSVGGASLIGTPGVDGWYPALQFTFAPCTDNVQVAACTVPWTGGQGSFPNATVQVKDTAGNSVAAAVPPFKFDSVDPPRADLIAPGTLVAAEPTFRWFPRSVAATPDVSGINEFQVQYRVNNGQDNQPWVVLAKVPGGDAGLTERSAQRGTGLAPNETPPPLPENTEIEWRVRSQDRAGNFIGSLVRAFTIDPTIPPAPSITGGPVGPTRNTTPTFSWSGSGDSFKWQVVPAGSQNPLRSGTTSAKEIQVGTLNDGAYTFRLTQFTAAGGESAEALQSFVVDTTPPSAPVILTRPTFPSLSDAIFTWSTEPGAYSRWSVADQNGGAVVSPTDTPVTSATLPLLAENAYSFGVQQIDAAGNVSPATVEPFTVIAPLVAPSPSANIVTLLPKQNARRLQPKAGKTLFSRTPVLRWTRGPKGTKLFNLQIFRVSVGKNARTPKVTKILSVFPKATAYRVPKSKTRPRTCYVWRVWPYTGREFTPKPLGVSNYCIASQKVLTKKASLVAKRKAAKVAARSRR